MRSALLMLCLIVPACFGIQSCKQVECEEAFNLADLVITEKNLQLVSTSASSTDYEIIHTILNTAEGILCNKDKFECSSVADAAPSNFGMELFYDSTSATPASWGNAVASFATDINQLVACKTATAGDIFSFLQDGYYLVRATVDMLNAVSERDENNNTELTGAGKQQLSVPMIIHVNRGLRTHEYQDGKPVYVKRIRSTVTYE